VDLDQLLRTVPGEGVLSLQLRNHPKLVGQRIEQLFKPGAKIPVFALSRENQLIWNPTQEIQLRYNDIIICYGDLSELRASLRAVLIDLQEGSQPQTRSDTSEVL
jgi:Trk K+ transport system NAD-binding subunit